MKMLLGRKLQMGQVWGADGNVIPVTYIQAGPCEVVQIKTIDRDGYAAVQIGYGVKKHPSLPLVGHTKGLVPFQELREFRDDGQKVWSRGEKLDVAMFEKGEKVNVVGISKGKGFQGVVKRHHFRGAPATHGHKHDLRAPGSIGAGGVQRVFRGMRMAGRMGGERVTVKNLEIVAVDVEKHLLALRGAIPGARRTLIMIQSNPPNAK